MATSQTSLHQEEEQEEEQQQEQEQEQEEEQQQQQQQQQQQEEENTIDFHVKNLEEAIKNQKLFKKENKELFNSNRFHIKNVNKLKDTLFKFMKNNDIDKTIVDSTEVFIKKESNQKHSPELIEKLLNNQNKFDEYMSSIGEMKENVVTRKIKKHKK